MPLVFRRKDDHMPQEDWQSIAAQRLDTINELIVLQARSSRERARQEDLINHLLVQRDYLRATRAWYGKMLDFLFPYLKPGPISDQALKDLIAQCAIRVTQYDGRVGQREAIRQLAEYVKPNCHTKPDDINANMLGSRMELEWFAGQLLYIVEEQDMPALATWLSLVPHYTKE